MAEVIVLCYHAISPSWDAALSVTPDALDRQLGTLVRSGWKGSTFSEALFDPPAQRTVAVTFDDGFASVIERAYPILSALDLPATVFAPSAFMSHRQPLQWSGIERWLAGPFSSELECMTWDELGVLAERGWEIGSHTRTHPHLTQLDAQVLSEELHTSRAEIAANLGRSCTTVAYPYGDVDERVAAAAKSAGYRAGAALVSRSAPGGPHRWPRIGVYHLDRPWRFRLKVNPFMRRVRLSPLWPSR